MKKILALILALCMTLSFAACGETENKTATAGKETVDLSALSAAELCRAAADAKEKAASWAIEGELSSSADTARFSLREKYVRSGYEAFSYSYTVTQEAVSTPVYGLYYQNGTASFFDGEQIYCAANLSTTAFNEQLGGMGAHFFPLFSDWSEVEGIERSGMRVSVSLDHAFPSFWQKAASGELKKVEGEQTFDESGFFASEKLSLTEEIDGKKITRTYSVAVTALRDSAIRPEEAPMGAETCAVNDLRAPLLLKSALQTLASEEKADLSLTEGVRYGIYENHSEKSVAKITKDGKTDFTVQESGAVYDEGENGEFDWTYFLRYVHYIGNERTEVLFPLDFSDPAAKPGEPKKPAEVDPDAPDPTEPDVTAVTEEEKAEAYRSLLLETLPRLSEMKEMQLSDNADAYEIRFRMKTDCLAERIGNDASADHLGDPAENEGLLLIEKTGGLMKSLNVNAAWKDENALTYRLAYVLNGTDEVQLGTITPPEASLPEAGGAD